MNKNIINKLNRSLAPLGFRKDGSTWRRNHRMAFDVVGLQLAQYSTGVTVKVGIYFKNLGNETNPTAEMCQLRKALHGSVDGVAVEAYAEEFDDSDDQVGRFVTVLQHDGLPWFDAAKTRKGALAALAQTTEAASPALLDAMKYGTIEWQDDGTQADPQ